MERTLYHGSEFIIKKPEFLKGNMHNRELSSSLRNNFPRELKYFDVNYLLFINEK